MAVFRIEKTRDYTVMSNHHLKDRTLTLKSKGLLSMMLSLPDEWNYTTRGLAAICREGVDSIGAALKELETHGYIRRTQLRDEKGKITDTEYVIYEMPQCEPPSSPGTPLPGTAKPYTENPDMGIPDTAEPCTENPAQLNTNQTKTDLSSTELSNPMATLGNREDLFPDSGYVDKYTKPPTTYDIPPSALEDETFAALITEAEKYIGYPYVWGGSNPNTSFDCSGFVSWVLTQSGVCNTGRLGAQGLYNISTPVSSANARPGDLIFFVGTYDTPGVSHVGIYVGGGKMLHCGDPIQYADINTSYWQSHFYAFGRPPYN